MACYRLTFENRQVFDIEIDDKRAVRGSPATVCVGLIYRVTQGARETEPLHREIGGPLEVYATSPDAALLIAQQVLRDVTGSNIASVGRCSAPPGLPFLNLI